MSCWDSRSHDTPHRPMCYIMYPDPHGRGYWQHNTTGPSLYAVAYEAYLKFTRPPSRAPRPKLEDSFRVNVQGQEREYRVQVGRLLEWAASTENK